MGKIRVENQPGIETSSYEELSANPPPTDRTSHFRVALVKPFQPGEQVVHGPPLGLISLAASLRQLLGDRVEIELWDMKLYLEQPRELPEKLKAFRPDVVGVSALNFEASASFDIAAIAKAWSSSVITVLGGPFTLRQSNLVFEQSLFDWVFEGPADRTFPLALWRHFSGEPLGADLPGFHYRLADGRVTGSAGQDLLTDIDHLPFPAWDLVDLERYRRHDRPRIISNFGEMKYAYLFTSRGCPYLCNYCHDTFTKRFVYQSVDTVIEHIRRLHEEHGVEEIHVVDDIFNLHKPRVQAIMEEVKRRWGKRIRFAFPNGLRGDILDKPTISAMVNAGTYHATISIETVTTRLQTMTDKHLDVEKALWAIDEFDRHDVITQGSFMLGFPTESEEEIRQTIRSAVKSRLSFAHFFAVLPQPNTPIHDQAMAEAPKATRRFAELERQADYNGSRTWYEEAYGLPLGKLISQANFRFYFYPRRTLRLLRLLPFRNIATGGLFLVRRALRFIAPPASVSDEDRDKPTTLSGKSS